MGRDADHRLEQGRLDGPAARLGDRIGRLIGAAPGTVVLGDTLSIKVYQALAAALELRPDRRKILSRHAATSRPISTWPKGCSATLGQGHELVTVAPEEVAGAIDDDSPC